MTFFSKKMSKILFIKESNFKTTAYYEDKEENVYSLNSFLNDLAHKYFFTISIYKKMIRKYLPLKNKIPIYFSDKILLFYLLDNLGNRYLINYNSLAKICYDNEVLFLFKNGYILSCDVNKKIINNELKKVYSILEYMHNK